MGIAEFTPRMTFSGPTVKDGFAFTESLEYRYERDQLYSLPPLQNDTRTETFDSYTQLDITRYEHQPEANRDCIVCDLSPKT
jgi:hypothetical protein